MEPQGGVEKKALVWECRRQAGVDHCSDKCFCLGAEKNKNNDKKTKSAREETTSPANAGLFLLCLLA